YDITVRLEKPFRQSIEDIQNLTVISPYSGRQIRLSNIAKVKETIGPLEIERKNRERVLMVECNIHDRSMGEVVADVRIGISKMPLPEGVAINFGGEAEEQKEAFKDLFTLLVLGIILVYMVMAAQFESFLDPFIVVFSIPFTFTGVLLAFILTGTTLNVMSFLGVVMLMGIVVNNAIVLISYINILRSRNFSVKDSIISGCRDRLRPVLMTTLSTIVAMCPLAFFRGEGSESWQPLGITMIGGLSVSAFVTLFLIPTVYAIFEMRKENNREIIS
ncbi:MAG: efflux RND transporter permease subunit, partial [Candidatus Aureabacteria bacterium]|nr:efflux RND transporter permease subunit [Candidatus Auribacterota bacterium]